MKKLLLLIRIFLCLLPFLIIFLIQQTNSLKDTRYVWASGRVPPGFDGYTIALVSDLHNKRFGKNQVRLVRAVWELQPDLIALTGDFADLQTKNLDSVRELLEGVHDLVPMYYVDGNHDPESPFYDELLALLEEYEVTVLDGEEIILTQNNDKMTLTGFPYWHPGDTAADIVLFHDPAALEQFAAQGCGLVLAGHIHGGQVALPGGRAILGPSGGLFPKYSGGVYTEGETTLVLSRGLGTSGFPFRAFSRPEVVGVELKHEK